MAANSAFPYPDPNNAVESLEPVVAGMHAGFEAVYNALPSDLPGDDAFKSPDDYETITVPRPDGGSMNLYVFRSGKPGPAPAVMYHHGGGMTILSTPNKSTANGAAILQGESGGANLSLAVALRAKREGWIDAIAGVSGQSPYLAGPAYAWSDERKAKELPSLLECDGYLLQCANMIGTARWYCEQEDPVAWPYFASEEDLKGLPPHRITVMELDPLKSEGIAYHYKLLAAGVRSTASTSSTGLVHAASLFLRQSLPDEHFKEIRDIAAFAHSL